MKQTCLRLIALALMFIVAGCGASPKIDKPDDVAGPPSGNGSPERVLGMIEFYKDPLRIAVPAVVEHGKSFAVTVTTYGGGCIRKGETEVVVEALRAEVKPYDYDTTPTLPVNSACTADLRLYEHTATLSFAKTGAAEVVFFGRKKDGNNITQITATRTLTVR